MASQHRNPLFEKVEEDAEYEVSKVLSEISWDGALPIDLEEVCEIYDFKYKFEVDPEMKHCGGKVAIYAPGDFSIIINTSETDCLDGLSADSRIRRRQRFSFAHEIGHCVYPSHQNLALQRNLSNPANPHSHNYIRKRENQANQFAANILIPRQAFKQNIRNCEWDNIAKLVPKVVERFDVSLQVAIQRTASLADFPCMAIIFKTDGLPLRVPSRSSDFSDTRLYFGRDQKVPNSTLAASMLSGNSQQQGARRRSYSDASDWFPESGWRATKYSINETSFSLGRYGVATFLELAELC